MKKKIYLALAAILLCLSANIAKAENAKYEQNDNDTRRTMLRDSILGLISGAERPEYKVSITKFGAKGNGTADCFKAFQKAMKHAAKRGGAHIVVPAGTYFIKGPVTLVSNVCLELEEGATLKFDPTPELYPIVNSSWEGTYLYNYSPMIYGYGLENVSIIGKGCIDGNAMSTFATWKEKQGPGKDRSRKMNHEQTPLDQRRFGEGYWLRPQLMQLYNCKNITLEGVKITNAPFWCIHLLKSENIICRALRYDAKLVNNDGIDPECSKNILIEDIHFNNGDDNVAIKSGRDDDGRNGKTPSENIIIRNCHFKGLHAVVIGSEMSGGVRNVIVENCDYAGYCKRGIYIKTNPDRGGFVENLYVYNCEFDEVEDLFYATSMYAGEGMDNIHFSTVRNIFVNGIKCKKVLAAALVLQGTDKKPIQNVEFRNITVDEAKIGISFDKTQDVTMQNCHIGGRVGVPSTAAKKDNLWNR